MFAIVGVLGLFSACQAEPSPASTVGEVTESASSPPRKARAPKSNSDLAAWRDRIRQSGEQSKGADIAQRYGDVLKAANATEQARLAMLGFPTVDELKRLSSLSSTELQARIDAGDKRALWYLTDQLSAGLRALQVARAQDQLPVGISEMDVGRATLDVMDLARQTLRGVDGPFGAYVYGQAMGSTTYPPNSEAIAASFGIAGERGDWRSENLYQSYVASHPGLDTSAVESHRRMMATLMRNPR